MQLFLLSLDHRFLNNQLTKFENFKVTLCNTNQTDNDDWWVSVECEFDYLIVELICPFEASQFN